jgi:hypothetical protein
MELDIKTDFQEDRLGAWTGLIWLRIGIHDELL